MPSPGVGLAIGSGWAGELSLPYLCETLVAGPTVAITEADGAVLWTAGAEIGVHNVAYAAGVEASALVVTRSHAESRAGVLGAVWLAGGPFVLEARAWRATGGLDGAQVVALFKPLSVLYVWLGLKAF